MIVLLDYSVYLDKCVLIGGTVWRGVPFQPHMAHIIVEDWVLQRLKSEFI